MDMLEQLRKHNPHLPLFSVLDPAFAPYGRVLPILDPASLKTALAQTKIPEAGNRYVASDPVLEATIDVRPLAKTVYGGMAVQAGCDVLCNSFHNRCFSHSRLPNEGGVIFLPTG